MAGRGTDDGPVLGSASDREPNTAEGCGPDRAAPAVAVDLDADRSGARDGRVDGVRGAGPARVAPPVSPGATGAAEPVLPSSSRRTDPHRRQEAREVQHAWASRHRAWLRPQPSDRLGVLPCRDRRHQSARVRRGPRERTGNKLQRVLAASDRMVRHAGHPGAARHDRQRPGLLLEAPRGDLRRARDPPPPHPSLPAAHQRQGRTLHPNTATRMGLRERLQRLPTPPTRAQHLAHVLQLPTTPQRPRPPTANLTTGNGRLTNAPGIYT